MRPAAVGVALAALAAVAASGCATTSTPGGVQLLLTGRGTADLHNLTVSLDQVRIQHMDGDRDPRIAELADLQDVDLGTANATWWGRAVFPTDAGELWITVHADGDDARGQPQVWTQTLHIGPIDLAVHPDPTVSLALTAVRHGAFEPTYGFTVVQIPA